MIVRPAELSDVDAIARTHVAGWQHAYAGILPADYLASLSVERRAATWTEAIRQKTQQLLVAEATEELAGFCAFGGCRDPGAAATDFEVWAIYLGPQFLGTGVGRRLWLEALGTMKGAGALRITLWVLCGNLRAIHFYRAAGFTEDQGSLRSVQIGGVSVPEIRYARPVENSAV